MVDLVVVRYRWHSTWTSRKSHPNPGATERYAEERSAQNMVEAAAVALMVLVDPLVLVVVDMVELVELDGNFQ